jgi:hypothetical protein
MCQIGIAKRTFLKQLKYHKVRFARFRSDNRSFRRNINKCLFFQRHSEAFGVTVLFDINKRTFETIKSNKPERDILIKIPACYLPEVPHRIGEAFSEESDGPDWWAEPA